MHPTRSGKEEGLFNRLKLNKSRTGQPPIPETRQPPTLPVELVQKILSLLTPAYLWPLRLVHPSWKTHIERLSAPWLVRSCVVFEDNTYASESPSGSSPPRSVFRICIHQPPPPGSWPLATKDSKWLIYALPRKPVFPAHIAPPRHPNGRFLWEARLEAERERAKRENPRWANELLEKKMRIALPQSRPGAEEGGRTVKLYAPSHKKVEEGKALVGYDLWLTEREAYLKIDWRMVFSIMSVQEKQGRAERGGRWKMTHHGHGH